MPSPTPFSRQTGESHTLFSYLRPIRARWIAGLTVSIIIVIVELMIPQVLSFIVDAMVGGSPTSSTVWLGGLIVLGVAAAQVSLVMLRRFLLVDSASTVEQQMRLNIVDKLLRQPISFHDRWPSGQLLQRSMGDLNTLRQWMTFGLVQLISVAVMLVVGSVLLLRGSPLLTLIYVCSVPLMVFVTWRFVKGYRELTRQSQEMAGDLATTVEESVHGVRVLKALGRGQHALAGFAEDSARLRDLEVTRSRFMGKLMMQNSLIVGVTSLITLGVGINQVAHNQLSVGELTAFFATTAILNAQVERAGTLMGIGLGAKVSLDRHRSIVDTPDGEDIPLLSDSSRNERTGNGRASAPMKHSVQSSQAPASLSFSGVRFAYSEAAPAVLTNFSLEIEPGEIIALVGVTGSGKSTVLQLVPRLYDATAGTISIDGVDVKSLSIHQLRQQVSFAFEEPVLFSDTVRENVLLGVDRSRMSAQEADARLRLGLDVASADFVEKLPEGVDSVIGEEGMNLSGGQRQRLSLARAIAAQPRVMLLDDPLSALDVNTEEFVMQQLKKQLVNTTTLLTAHRPSTVALADRVAVMKEGAIIAVGTPAHLQSHPEYRALMAPLDESKEG
ncbi:ABC transporter ATP-binding protein [Rothia sp. ZJ932]|uniref:ABC transporter ATP-binding protein n=1 Tax=Rothia sp. ZJ932 TaxID=2810516 RepID=UPI00196715B7|nr:ABC transporter ATP-binding protein [Rothia sp. ZJ932]QRZ61953.1 ABC transporter ATP-binding protein [Rothia sp. ZJ932]